MMLFLLPKQVSAQNINVCPTEPWKLVFYDEFDGIKLNPDNWSSFYRNCWKEDGTNYTDQCLDSRIRENESQVYLDKNVVVNNGKLALQVYKETSTWYNVKRDYSSGMIFSNRNYKYGKFEIRCKIPCD